MKTLRPPPPLLKLETNNEDNDDLHMQNEVHEPDSQSTPTFAAGAASVTPKSPDFGQKA